MERAPLQLSYESVKASHIHVLWPRALEDKNACPRGLCTSAQLTSTRARPGPRAARSRSCQLRDCINCEDVLATTTRSMGRDGEHRSSTPCSLSAVARLLAA